MIQNDATYIAVPIASKMIRLMSLSLTLTHTHIYTHTHTHSRLNIKFDHLWLNTNDESLSYVGICFKLGSNFSPSGIHYPLLHEQLLNCFQLTLQFNLFKQNLQQMKVNCSQWTIQSRFEIYNFLNRLIEQFETVMFRINAEMIVIFV